MSEKKNILSNKEFLLKDIGMMLDLCPEVLKIRLREFKDMDPESFDHSVRLAASIGISAKELDLDVKLLLFSALIHDSSKVESEDWSEHVDNLRNTLEKIDSLEFEKMGINKQSLMAVTLGHHDSIKTYSSYPRSSIPNDFIIERRSNLEPKIEKSAYLLEISDKSERSFRGIEGNEINDLQKVQIDINNTIMNSYLDIESRKVIKPIIKIAIKNTVNLKDDYLEKFREQVLVCLKQLNQDSPSYNKTN